MLQGWDNEAMHWMKKRSHLDEDPREMAADRRNNVVIVDGDIIMEEREKGRNKSISCITKDYYVLINNNLCPNWNAFERERGCY